MLALLNEPSFIRNIGDRGVRTIDQASTYIEQGPVASYDKYGFGLLLVTLKESQTPIGICGLIKRDELDIYDISLERITKQYLEYLQAFKELNIDVAGEFVVMAANLIYLKSRSLLPVDQQPPEEDVEEDDPRWRMWISGLRSSRRSGRRDTLTSRHWPSKLTPGRWSVCDGWLPSRHPTTRDRSASSKRSGSTSSG